MSLLILKDKFTEDIRACRACLATNKSLNSINQDELSEAYTNLCGIQVSPHDTLPQYICDSCSDSLIKYRNFRELCHQAKRYLEEAQMKNIVITLEHLNNFNSIKPEPNFTITNTASDNGHVDDTDHNFDSNEDYDHQHINLSQDRETMKVYTDTIKIKTQDKEKTNKKGEYVEKKDYMCVFEELYDVSITILSTEQQMKDVLERKLKNNYLHSPYKCELCFKGFMAADTLKKHFIYQHDPSRGEVVCEFCQFRYKDRRGLNQHLKTHRLKFACKRCPFVSRTIFHAKEHFKMHNGSMHVCQHCKKSYEKQSSLLSHLRLHHPSEFIWCDLCGEAFIGTFGLNAHKKKAHRNLPLLSGCPRCDRSFANSTALERHSTFDTCDGHSCLRCGDRFQEALELRNHLLEKHRSCEVFPCEKCNKTFARESLYSAHYKRIHVDSEEIARRRKERPWICEICGKALPNKCVLLYHQRTHTGEKPYHCSQCPKKFTLRRLLQSHLKVHTNDRPYACKICPKAFKRLTALRAHENMAPAFPN